jgi:hypothetical protein
MFVPHRQRTLFSLGRWVERREMMTVYGMNRTEYVDRLGGAV